MCVYEIDDTYDDVYVNITLRVNNIIVTMYYTWERALACVCTPYTVTKCIFETDVHTRMYYVRRILRTTNRFAVCNLVVYKILWKYYAEKTTGRERERERESARRRTRVVCLRDMVLCWFIRATVRHERTRRHATADNVIVENLVWVSRGKKIGKKIKRK